MRIGEEPALALVAGDHEAGAGGCVLALALPGQREIGVRVHTVHLRGLEMFGVLAVCQLQQM